MNNIFAGLFKKLKSIKHIEIILALLIGLIILLVYFSNMSSKEDEPINTTNTTYSSYVGEIEGKLSKILSKIEGAGKVSVMVMLEGETVFEKNTLPNINSVIVVAEGAENVYVKLELIKAVETLFGLEVQNIEILTGGDAK